MKHGSLLQFKCGKMQEMKMINTLAALRRLEEAGVPRQQAEAQVQLLAELVDTDLATKRDLKDLEYRLTIKTGAIVGSMLTVFGVVNALIRVNL